MKMYVVSSGIATAGSCSHSEGGRIIRQFIVTNQKSSRGQRVSEFLMQQYSRRWVMKTRELYRMSGVILIMLTAAFQGPARAQADREFIIVKLAGGRAYINAGSQNGAAAGMTVTFCEPVGGKDTVGMDMLDIIPIAQGTLKYVGERNSIVIVDSAAFQNLRVGYFARLPITTIETKRPRAVTEMNSFRESRDTMTHAVPAKGEVQQRPRSAQSLGFTHNPPSSATIYAAVPITVYAPAPMGTPVLYYRVHGKTDYKAVELAEKPNDYYLYEIPKDEVAEPAIEYYITVKLAPNETVLAIGNPESPAAIPVSGFLFNPDLELARHRGNRNTFRVLAEHVIFRDKDSYEHYEADYLYRIFTSLYSVRMGMGAFRGEGYTSDAVSSVSQTLNYYYGYTEIELKPSPSSISLIARFLTGINNEGIGSGFDSRLRFGDELGVNLVVGVWSTARIGTSTTVQLNVPLTARFGFSGNIAVEDLPVEGPTGFRMAVDLKYELAPDLDVTGRIGMAARNTDFIGSNFGFGLARNF
jgi:hypothetical protein